MAAIPYHRDVLIKFVCISERHLFGRLRKRRNNEWIKKVFPIFLCIFVLFSLYAFNVFTVW